MPGFAKAKTFYENEYPENSKKPWPYFPEPLELGWEKQLKDLINPSTREYYTSSTGEQPKATVTQIIRIKTNDGREFLYSIGSVRFYNMYGDEVDVDRTKPETYERAVFHHKTAPNADGHAVRVTDEIVRKVLEYDMPFTPENVDKLWSMKSPDGCMLIVKDEASTKAKQCPDMEMFKNQSINYIINDEWQAPYERELKIREEELMTGRKKR